MTVTIVAGSLRPTRTITASLSRGAAVTTEIHDRTRPFLLLHGGGGPGTMSGFATLIAERSHSRTVLPTHPGFAGTARLDDLDSIQALAAAYIDLIGKLDLADLTLVGNSFGGWLAAEMALLNSPRVSGAVLIDAIGADVPGHPVADLRGRSPAEIAELSWHDPGRAPVPATGASGPSQDLQALLDYTPGGMTDPTLLERLTALDLPVHVVWGESDRIVGLEHGRAIADAIPMSTLTVVPRAGHLPQLEAPEETFGAIWELGR